jgi:hypothetical protein
MCTVCVALSCCLSADICAPTLMTSLFNTILKVLAPVTVSHQPYIISNVSLKKKNRKILTDTPPPSPRQVSYTLRSFGFWRVLPGLDPPFTLAQTQKKQNQIHRHTHTKPTPTLSLKHSRTPGEGEITSFPCFSQWVNAFGCAKKRE